MVILLESDEFRAKLRAEKAHASYETLEKRFGVNRFYLWHLLNDENYQPPPKVATALGIRVYLPAPACPRCGKVHVTRRCTERLKNREYRDLWDMPVTELRRRLEQRTEF